MKKRITSPSFRYFHDVVPISVTVNTSIGRELDPLGLDQDLVLEEVWRGQGGQGGVHRVGPQEVPQYTPEQLRHPVLLLPGAVVLYRQDQGVGGGGESVGLDGVRENVFEEQLGGESPAVVNDGLTISSVPTVQLECKAFDVLIIL